eukprot:g799.t1
MKRTTTVAIVVIFFTIFFSSSGIQRDGTIWEFDHEANTWIKSGPRSELLTLFNYQKRRALHQRWEEGLMACSAGDDLCENANANLDSVKLSTEKKAQSSLFEFPLTCDVRLEHGLKEERRDRSVSKKNGSLYEREVTIPSGLYRLSRIWSASIFVVNDAPSGQIFELFWNGTRWVYVNHAQRLTSKAVSVTAHFSRLFLVTMSGRVMHRKHVGNDMLAWVDVSYGSGSIVSAASASVNPDLYFVGKYGSLVYCVARNKGGNKDIRSFSSEQEVSLCREWRTRKPPTNSCIAAIIDPGFVFPNEVFVSTAEGRLFSFGLDTNKWREYIRPDWAFVAPYAGASVESGGRRKSIFMVSVWKEIIELRFTFRKEHNRYEEAWISHGSPFNVPLASPPMVTAIPRATIAKKSEFEDEILARHTQEPSSSGTVAWGGASLFITGTDGNLFELRGSQNYEYVELSTEDLVILSPTETYVELPFSGEWKWEWVAHGRPGQPFRKISDKEEKKKTTTTSRLSVSRGTTIKLHSHFFLLENQMLAERAWAVDVNDKDKGQWEWHVHHTPYTSDNVTFCSPDPEALDTCFGNDHK